MLEIPKGILQFLYKTVMNKQLEIKFQRLEELKYSIVTLLQDTSEEILNRKPFENKWSPLQVLHHIIRAEQAAMIGIKRSLKDYHLKDDLGFWGPFKTLQLKFLFGLPLKFKAPKGVDNIPDNPVFDELVKKWVSVRKDMMDFFKSIPPDAMNKNLFSTWYSNKMNIYHVSVFLVLHSERHYSQIKNLIRIS